MIMLIFCNRRRTLPILVLFTIVCILVSHHHAQSQGKFQNGYIINLEGDTISGLILVKRGKLHDVVYFKDQALRKEIEYAPVEIKGFVVEDEIYKSVVVNKSFNDDHLFAQSKHLKQDTIFLQVLVSGKKNLFRRLDTHGKMHYLIHTEDGFLPLHFNEYSANSKIGQVADEQKNYKNQLKAYLQDCHSIAPVIDQAKPSYKAIIEIFINYYACTQTKAEYMVIPKKATLESHLIAGKIIIR